MVTRRGTDLPFFPRAPLVQKSPFTEKCTHMEGAKSKMVVPQNRDPRFAGPGSGRPGLTTKNGLQISQPNLDFFFNGSEI